MQKNKQSGDNNVNASVGGNNYAPIIGTQIIHSASSKKNVIDNQKAFDKLLKIFRSGSAEHYANGRPHDVQKERKGLKDFIENAFKDVNESDELVDLYEKTMRAIDALIAGEKQTFITEWNSVGEELRQRINILNRKWRII